MQYISIMNNATRDYICETWEPCPINHYTYQKAVFDSGGYMVKGQVIPYP